MKKNAITAPNVVPCMVELATPNGGVHYAQAYLNHRTRVADVVDPAGVEATFGDVKQLRVVAVQWTPGIEHLNTRPTRIASAIRMAYPPEGRHF